MSLRPVILSCAITGAIADRRQCPAIPYTPAEIAAEAKRAYEAGATIAHIHARGSDGRPSWRTEVFAEIKERVSALCPILLNFSTGGVGNTIEERAAASLELCPDMAAVNMGSMNYGVWSRKERRFHYEAVFQNPFSEIQWLLERLGERAILPELECFDAGHICNADFFIEMGLLASPIHFSLVMGVCGGIKATRQCLESQAALLPPGSQFQVIGIGREQWKLAEWGLELGGNIRVGLEDNFYLPDQSMASSNADLCAAGERLIRSKGGRVANLSETRGMLGLDRPLLEAVASTSA